MRIIKIKPRAVGQVHPRNTMKYTIGIDFGTNSVRAIVVRLKDGISIGTGIYSYPSGKSGVLIDPENPHCARQNPADYHKGLEISVREAIAEATDTNITKDFSPSMVIGIGVDTTGSSPIPVDKNNIPLAFQQRWKDNLAAQCWLWKDHTSASEAKEITQLAKECRPHFVARCGNAYSSEWFWAKILHCLRTAPEVFEAAWSWVELADYIPAILSGINNPAKILRGVCAAGHKAMYSDDWGGLPDKEFLTKLDPRLADLRDRLFHQAWDVNSAAGSLCSHWAKTLGLPVGIPVAMGALDVHYGAIGSGVKPGMLTKSLGTSSCDCGVIAPRLNIDCIPGISGIVFGSILPGCYGIEAGQSAVGDIFKWWVEGICKGDGKLYLQLEKEAQELKPGESGLLALDWNNGNRSILGDPHLSGMILGLSLHSTQAEIYRTLIEATAFGSRIILARLKEYGVPLSHIVCCGGLAEKNSLLMQIYADILKCTMHVSQSDQSCALGAALVAAVLAGKENGGFASIKEAQEAMTGVKEKTFHPNPEAGRIYDELFDCYRSLHDSFGGVRSSVSLEPIMKKLLDIQKQTKTCL